MRSYLRVLVTMLLSLCLQVTFEGEVVKFGRHDIVPKAGGLLFLPQEQLEKMAITNPGFENGWNSWRANLRGAFSIVKGEGVAHAGDACLRLDCEWSTRYVPILSQELRGVRHGVYVLSFWVKTRNVGPAKVKGPRRQGVCVGITVRLSDGREVRTQVLGGTGGWRRIELRAYFPPGLELKSVSINIFRYGKPAGGEAFFDDFVLLYVKPPPVEAFLFYPNYRGYLAEGAPQQVRVWVKVNDATAGDAVRLFVKNMTTGELFLARRLPPTLRECIVKIDVSKWPLGSYALQVQLGEYAYPPYIIRKISRQQRRNMAVWFDEHNVLYIHGKPTFPLGLYNTTRHFYFVVASTILPKSFGV